MNMIVDFPEAIDTRPQVSEEEERERNWMKWHLEGAKRNLHQAIAGGNATLISRIAWEVKLVHGITLRIPSTLKPTRQPIKRIRGRQSIQRIRGC